MKSVNRFFLVFIAFAFLFSITAYSQNTRNNALRVGIKQAAPFVIKNHDGTWSGISIELWEAIAKDLGLGYELYEFDLKGLVQALEQKKVDVGVAALTINAEREEVFDFSQPFYNSGLGIAVRAKASGSLVKTMRRIFSLEFFKIVFALFLVLLFFGFLVWIFERKKNKEQFSANPLDGIGSGLWWSAVTMTTVGYGDKVPKTLMGKLVAVVWMFMAIIIISSFTAAITSALTVSQLDIGIKNASDLYQVAVGTVMNATSEQYLRGRGIKFYNYTSIEEGYDALIAKKIDAFVYDAPLLRYQANQSHHGQVAVLPYRFEHQNYGIAFPSNSPLREEVNRVLLKRIKEKEWENSLRLYLGE